MTAHPILFVGDPHRNFAPILRACAALPPGVLILLGDCECDAPLPEMLAPAVTAGWDVRWILGNRDTDSARAYENWWGRIRRATLAGGSWSWVDCGSPACRAYSSRASGTLWNASRRSSGRVRTSWQRAARGGALARRAAAMASRYDLPGRFRSPARGLRFDVLVTHELPSSHRHGFAVIDALAGAGRRTMDRARPPSSVVRGCSWHWRSAYADWGWLSVGQGSENPPPSVFARSGATKQSPTSRPSDGSCVRSREIASALRASQ